MGSGTCEGTTLAGSGVSGLEVADGASFTNFPPHQRVRLGKKGGEGSGWAKREQLEERMGVANPQVK